MIVSWNKVTERVFGYSGNEVVGYTLSREFYLE
jgi:PAS domain-containing protein